MIDTVCCSLAGKEKECAKCDHSKTHLPNAMCTSPFCAYSDHKPTCQPVAVIVKRKETVLEEAARVVDGPRRNDYGTPSENHSRTAAMWSKYLGIEVTMQDVCMLNILQKCARGAHRITRDTLVDIAGYARNAELCEEKQ